MQRDGFTRSAKRLAVPTRQTLLDFTPGIDKERDRLGALAAYHGGLPLDFFDEQATRDFFSALTRNTYKPPSADRLRGVLLDQTYLEYKRQVDAVVSARFPLNIISYQGRNKNWDQVFNVAALFKEHQPLLLYSETKEWSSKVTHFDWTLQNLDHLTGSHFDQINSLTIDDGPFEFDSESFAATCSKIISDPRLQNVPLIPRDSHGLQVVMDDLRSLSAIEPFFQKAQEILGWFCTAVGQICLLRKHQTTVYGEEQSFIVPAVLGWGNKFHLLDALDRNRAALKMYAMDKEAKFTRGKNRPASPVQDHIRDSGFWNDLDDILCLLQPICQQQKISESGDSTLQMVYPRWLGIETHLTSQMSHSRFGPALRDYLQGQFRSRREIYVASVHKAAYFLHPLNSGKALDPIDRAEVLTFLKRSTPESQQSLVERSFDRFRAREFEFDRADLWAIAKDSELFWTQMKANCTVLGKIGFRLARIQTNSLFPQRCLLWDENYQASRKVQADLPTEHAHKLNYIVLNNLALIGKGNNPEPTDREKLFELEEDWYWRDGFKRQAYKYHMDPNDEDEKYEESKAYEEDEEDELAEDESKAKDLSRGLKRERPESMNLATDHKK